MVGGIEVPATWNRGSSGPSDVETDLEKSNLMSYIITWVFIWYNYTMKLYVSNVFKHLL